jgi:hypothetical protein
LPCQRGPAHDGDSQISDNDCLIRLDIFREGAVFRLSYSLYRSAHRILVGRPIRVGNFSVLPWGALAQLGVVPELWNHYAAAVFRGQLPHCSILLHRGKRLRGRSRMDFVALVSHGVSAMTVFGDVVAVRLLIGATAVSIAGAAAVAATVIWAFGHHWQLYQPMRPWMLGVALLVGNGAMICFLLAFLLLNSRSQMNLLPEKYCLSFVDHLQEFRAVRA